MRVCMPCVCVRACVNMSSSQIHKVNIVIHLLIRLSYITCVIHITFIHEYVYIYVCTIFTPCFKGILYGTYISHRTS